MSETRQRFPSIAATGPLCRCGATSAWRWTRRLPNGGTRDTMRCRNGHFWRWAYVRTTPRH